MLSWEYPPRIIGGLARVVAELSKQMSQTGWEVHVVTSDHPGTAEHELIDGVHVHRVKTQTDPTPDFLTWVHRLNFGLLQYAMALHRKTPFSIVHAHDWMVGDAAWVMKVGMGLPLIATMHATESGRMHGIHTDLQRYIHRMEWRLTFEAWEVIVNSHHMHAELRTLFNLPADKIVIIPNGTDPQVFDFKFNQQSLRSQYANPSEKIVLYVGRMVREKGVQVLLDSAPKILAAYPNTKFLLVGTGYYTDNLKHHVSQLGLGDRVNFLGYVSDQDLLRIYKIADIVCIPSLYEPFGIVALEGMAAKVPVVTSDAGGLTDFVELMVTGITTYAGDSSSLAWGILEVLRNPELAQRLAQDAYEKVRNIYNWKVIARRTLEVYEKVLKEAQQIGPDGVASRPPEPILAASPALPLPSSTKSSKSS
ncbi:MAG: glycosyltransferase family 4 protein [Candidatus Melainabacteria bacterium]|nr:glycosyltransferase family 4 protein [Candidatus Melainabacteria bacterium]